jgi:lipid A 3-O-deacylase
MRRGCVGAAFAVGLCLGAPGWAETPPAPEPARLALSAGYAEIFDRRPGLFWGVEYRPAFRVHHVGPYLFLGSRERTSFYAAAGILLDLRLGKNWRLTPSFGVGYYRVDRGLDLGHDIEFRSGIELTRQFSCGHRLGLSAAHLSNGSLGEHNPGTELLQVVWSIPLQRRSRHPPPER